MHEDLGWQEHRGRQQLYLVSFSLFLPAGTHCRTANIALPGRRRRRMDIVSRAWNIRRTVGKDGQVSTGLSAGRRASHGSSA